MTNTNLKLWLKLAFSYGVGPATGLKLIQHFGSIENIFTQNFNSLSAVVSKGIAESLLSTDVDGAVDGALNWQSQIPENRHLLTLEHASYPAELAQIANPPLVLFAEGNLSLLQNPNKIAMVGTRHPSTQGIENAKSFASELASRGVTVVSGLAAGIDKAAHEGALVATNGASSIAVIGTGMDLVYPASNRETYRQMAKHGLILSEFKLGTPAQTQNFPRRNRVIVGLSKACLVVESASDGGSMISANFALEMGRDVMAIPGSIHNPMARGCHKLIKQGAKLIETASDVLDEFSVQQNTLFHNEINANDEDPILRALGYDPLSVDSLCAKLAMDFGELCGKLLELELAGQIINCGGGRYQRIFR